MIWDRLQKQWPQARTTACTVPSNEKTRIASTSRGSWSLLSDVVQPLQLELALFLYYLNCALTSNNCLLFSSPSLFNYPWLFFNRDFFFSEKLQSKFQSRKTKASLESERVIIASGMEDRRKCQIKGLNFKKQQRKTGKGEDENKVHQISKIMNQLLPNQTLSSMDPGAPCLLIWCFASCDSRLHSWKFYGSKVSAWKEAGRLQRESGELGMHEKMTGAKCWSDYGQWCLKMIL